MNVRAKYGGPTIPFRVCVDADTAHTGSIDPITPTRPLAEWDSAPDSAGCTGRVTRTVLGSCVIPGRIGYKQMIPYLIGVFVGSGAMLALGEARTCEQPLLKYAAMLLLFVISMVVGYIW